MNRKILILTFFCVASTFSMAQQIIPLYSGAIPNSISVPNEEKTEINTDGVTIISNITQPTMAVFLPDTAIATGTAVIIFPGGGYWINAYLHEGTDVAHQFNKMGIAAFVVKYRIPSDASMPNRAIGPIQDAQQAIKTVRSRALEWGILPDRIGVMGFSAGGHLASTAGTHFNRNFLPDSVSVSLRPDFMILIYPVISFREPLGHIGSREQLLGKTPNQAQIDYYSNELHVTPETPPTFLVHASDDWLSPQNSIQMYQRLIQNKVPAEMHLYQGGGHGFGMHNPTTADAWMDRCQNWIQSNGWLSRL